jgi:hypothetical protein
MLAALILTLVSCNSTDTLTSESAVVPEAVDGLGVDGTPVDATPVDATPIDAPLMAVSYAGGIPFGTTRQPNSWFTAPYNGALRIIGPDHLMSDLSAIRSRGGKIAINLSGGQSRYKDAAGNFSLTKWKASVNRFRNINFSSYIKDGTIIGHYLMDEPHNKSRWNGKVVSPATIEAMARYSKQLWPGMVTIVRAYPEYLAQYSGSYQYLDAAWAQYVYRKGPVADFTRSNIALAQRKGLALVVGLNILQGGPNGSRMSASQIKSWGSTLLSSSYPCAFISWEHNSTYLSSSSIKDAMRYLRSKAQSRSAKTCRS